MAEMTRATLTIHFFLTAMSNVDHACVLYKHFLRSSVDENRSSLPMDKIVDKATSLLCT